MATTNETKDKVLEQIDALLGADHGVNEANSRTILNLAEAWAWLTSPGVSHGGGPAS